MAWRLHRDLSDDLFDTDTKLMIEYCRVICDLKSIISKIRRKGSVLVGLEEATKFADAAKMVTGTIHSVSKDDIAQQYRMFMTCLENVFIKPRSDCSKLGSKEIIQRILKMENLDAFRTVRVIVHIICVASVKISVERILVWFKSCYTNSHTNC